MSNMNCPPKKKKSGTTDSSSQPQTSLARSTPIRETSSLDNVPLPNVSSIRSSCTSSESTKSSSTKIQKRSVNVENPISLLQISKINSEDSSDFGESMINTKKLKQFKNKGQNWNFIKPTNQNSLYFKIISRNDDVETLAFSWCKNYIDDKEEAIIELQQLFIDLTGVREFDLKDLLNKNNKQLEEAFKVLEDAVLDSNLEKYYLCNNTHQYSIACLKEICDFLKLVWVISINQGFFYHYDIYHDVLKLIKLMATNNVKVIHHTGIFLAIKVLTFTSEVNKTIILNEPLEKHELEEQLCQLLKIEKCLICMLHVYCCTNTAIPQQGKVQYLDEILHWFKNIPDLMFKEKHFTSFIALIEDPKIAKIRQKAVAISKTLVESSNFSQYIISVFEKLIETVEGRLWDVDYDVSINAVEFYCLLSDKYPRYLTSEIEVAIVKLIFQKYYPLARAAGQFTIKRFRRNHGVRGEIALIVDLMQLLSTRKFRDLTPLLVESVIDFAKELQNYDLIFTILMAEEQTEDEELALCGLLSQSVIQTVTGMSPITREKCRRAKPQELVNQKITYFFITRLYDLMKKFSSNADCTKKLCEILLVFDYEETPLTHYSKYIDQLMRLQVSLFSKSVNEDLLDSLSKLYSTWMADNSPFKMQACTTFARVLETTAHVCKSNLEEYIEENPTLEINLLRLEKLFCYNDLRRFIDWNTLFISWDLSDECFTIQSVERNMKCCYWFLLWEVRGLKDLNLSTDLLQEKVDQLELKCTSFIEQCLSIMSENQEKPTLLQTAFDVIIDLHWQFLHELSNKFNESEQFKQLHLKVSTIQTQNVLVDHVLTSAFTTTQKETLKVRRSNVAKLISAFIEDIIPHEKHFTKVFMFYDEYYNSYGDIFDSALDMFQKMGGVVVICSITVHTIQNCYNEYLSLKGTFDPNHLEVERINALGERFLQYLKRKAVEDSILYVLKYAVCYTAYYMESRHFLFFFHSFIPALKIDQHKLLYDHLMDIVFEDEEDARDTFVNFAKKLKIKKGK